MSRQVLEAVVRDGNMDAVLRSFPKLLQRLRASYDDLEARAEHVQGQLSSTNQELASKVAELDDVKRHLEAVLESLPCGVVVRDADGAVLRANRAAQEIFGEGEAQLRSRTDHALLDGMTRGGQPTTLLEAHRPDGRRCVLARRASTLGKDRGSVVILDDRTEQTDLTERLHASDKLASLGTMAAGIAHEIRNPLNAVKGFAALLLRTKELGPKASVWASRIVEGSTEADEIIQNMLSFGNPERLHLETIDANVLLGDAVQAVRNDHDLTKVQVRTSALAPAFVGDRIKLRQAVRNLVANAVEAQEYTGPIELSVDLADEEIVFRIADSGPGIPRDVARRILDPFFTTRADGTGLGLALVSAIARLHGGEVRVLPTPSPLGGADFRLSLPFQPAPEPVVPQDPR